MKFRRMKLGITVGLILAHVGPAVCQVQNKANPLPLQPGLIQELKNLQKEVRQLRKRTASLEERSQAQLKENEKLREAIHRLDGSTTENGKALNQLRLDLGKSRLQVRVLTFQLRMPKPLKPNLTRTGKPTLGEDGTGKFIRGTIIELKSNGSQKKPRVIESWTPKEKFGRKVIAAVPAIVGSDQVIEANPKMPHKSPWIKVEPAGNRITITYQEQFHRQNAWLWFRVYVFYLPELRAPKARGTK